MDQINPGFCSEALETVEVRVDYRYSESVPVLFGHYWMNGEPMLTAKNAACLDFSVAKNGYLTAYRWSGERELSLSNFVNVRAVEDYTPAEVSRVIARLIGISPQNTRASTTAYDPTCGSGSLLLKVAAITTTPSGYPTMQ